ncbi:translation initiation factor IF-2 N-terminal domain-containing protein [Gordonia tangerina]|uniref:Translation initiation factor IF-2 N-terminal domain-containing protein n=1 Tax=Gordonia tangerina TaxID=2911060 RepID=A0ABS9DF39_9ACTN|nr:translation initiation factor IF-2 N-terminal domain-containing protein [Gordonia tangerina]MCF3937723.1 translation initiation factor IF-2 N-terminal domain-containing protein [Gordonia tangerina]
MTDNGSPADANAASEPVEEFPSRLRVHALARALGMTSREVLAHLAEIGIETRSPQSSIDRETAQTVAARVRGAAERVDAPEQAETQVTPPEEAAVPAEEAASAESAGSSVEAAEQATTLQPAADQATPAQAVTGDDEPALPRESEQAATHEESPTLFSAVDQTQHHPVRQTAEDVMAQPLFLSPQAAEPTRRPTRSGEDERVESDESGSTDDSTGDSDTSADGERGSRRRRRGRRGRGRGRGDQSDNGADEPQQASDDTSDATDRSDGDNDSARPSGKKGKKGKKGDRSDGGKSGKDGADKGESGKHEDDKADADKDSTGKKRSEESTGTDEGSVSEEDSSDSDSSGVDDTEAGSSKRRRRRRRRKGGADAEDSSPDDPPNTVVHEREPRSKKARDEVQGISGSTRLEAKRQRRRDGRDAGRRRPPILSESEFLARREAVDRVMVVRERSANSAITGANGSGETGQAVPIEDYTQVAVLEDGVLVEHFVTTETSSSMVGNIYLGRVQNVLPGMEAAFVDIGRGRNGVLYAGEVNWDAAGLDGGSRKIEQALKPGDNVLVQVSKDPVGHKGARLTTQISLAGRFLVYVPGGSSTGISRKLPDVERKRLKSILGKLVPDDAGVIIRTASEGVSADELAADIARLEKQWKDIDSAVGKAKKGSGASAPQALYEEPDLLVRVVRDLFNEDFKKLVVEGGKAWDLVERYITAVAPDLMQRVERFEKPHADAPDSFVVHRIDEQLAKALDRKVWLPSGGTLIIEHTEAMTVVDVNTGKFTGSGGNLEETVTRNNLEAAEEIVRQMRLRDIGGMIIVDFIDMVLESNRDLVLRRLTEALARDRTRHQVSEVTSLGLVQMTRKRLGTGLLEAFSTPCTHCGGRGIVVHANPVEARPDESSANDGGGSKRSRRNRRKSEPAPEQHKPAQNPAEHPMFRAMAAHAHDHDHDHDHDVEGADGARGAAEQVASPDAGRRDDTRSADTRADDTHADETHADDGVVAATSDASATAQSGSATAADEHAAVASAPATEATPTDGAPDETTASSPAEPAGAASEPNESHAGASDAAASGRPRRRRRVVRQAAAPPKASEPIVISADNEVGSTPTPTTTFGPTDSSGTAEAAVAVRRRPRRRTAGRPAGPPPSEQ